MKHKILITMFTALGLSLSGASYALLIMMPDGTKTEAQIVGNRLMLQNATGKLTPARDGTYKTGDGTVLIVKGGIIATQGSGGTVGPSMGAAASGTLKAPAAGLTPNPSPSGGGAPAQTLSPSRTPAPTAPTMAPPAVGGAAVKVVRIEQLSSKAQFKALPDDTLLDVKGRQIRKADFVAEFNRRAAAGSAGAAIRPPELAATQARLRGEEDAAIAASAAEVRRRMAELRAQGGER